jgi:oligopeptide transport system ATP-binding protein
MEFPLLAVENLVTGFETDAGRVNAVNGVSFILHKGETIAIVGESGSGKSATMLSVMRLIQAPGEIYAGRVLFHGKDMMQLSEPDIRSLRGRRIAMIFQDPMTALNPLLTIGHQIIEVLTQHLALSKKAATLRTIELLCLVGIPAPEERLNDYPHKLSGGMRQRVMIAVALACDPEILIADEPTTSLDVTIQAQIVDLIKSLQEKMGMAVVWITHDLGIVASLADRVLVMYAGYIIETANVHELYESPSHPYTESLLASLPRLNGDRTERLPTIKGSSPNGINMPTGCAFAERCNYSRDLCRQKRPELLRVNLAQTSACWKISHFTAVANGLKGEVTNASN